MRPAVRDAFVAFTSPLEGVVPWMYADVKGLVTTAIGNLIDPMSAAMPLPWRRPNGTPASSEEVSAEWLRVKNDPNAARLGHRYTQRITSLRLTDDGVRDLVFRKLDENDAYLRKRFPDFEEWPADAQLATHSMAWACGPAFRFPRLEAALRARNWLAAADECHISTAGNPGIVPRNAENRKLYKNAAYAADPDVLHWPAAVDVHAAPTVPQIEDPPSTPTVLQEVEPFAIVRPTIYMGRPWEDDPDEPPDAA